MATQLELHDLGASMNAAVEKVRLGEEVTIAEDGQVEGLPLVTNDAQIIRYGVPVVW